MNSPEDVLGLWFAPGNELNWFEKDAAFDRAMGAALLPLKVLALEGRRDSQLGERSVETSMPRVRERAR